jgi:hypothetical protein
MYYGVECSIKHNDDETLTVHNYFSRKTFAIKDISAIHLRERKSLFNLITILNPTLFIQTHGYGTHMIPHSKEYEEDFRNLYNFLASRLEVE